ncbi:MAG: DUF1850 domain-containing protein [Pseudomonadota bacterium]|jgi:hypothetical protein
MSGVCLAAGAATVFLAVNGFTLAWQHSIEKIRWEEDYRVARGRLELVEARVHGSGAGMEPPAGARLDNGVWRYRPALAPLARLLLTHSPYAQGYELCLEGRCAPLAQRLPDPDNTQVIELRPCAP